ncbi:MAG: hypothetical protein P8I93_05645 [Crocinitomicaceae bacterium]|nr:hypothetical protein [Crocinitomicaceae bacterium]
MNNLKILLFLFVTINLSAQAPQLFTFQSIVRDAQNELITNTDVGVQISILQGSSVGSSVYIETHNPLTNENGLLTLQIGDGNVVSGVFNNIDWANGPYFLKTEIDPDGGTFYTIQGTNQLVSVPYALYTETAKTAINDQINDADSDPSNELQVISLSSDTLYLSNGGFVYLGSYAIDSINDADHDPTNELQNWANLPGIPTGFIDGIDNVDDADNDPTNEIELPTNANVGDILEYNGNAWLPVPFPSPSGPGTVMYIYNGQSCPSGWSTQQINVAIFGGVAVDACYTDSPCTVMYIYDGQSCPTGWTHQSIGAPVINGSTTPVDACFKCY